MSALPPKADIKVTRRHVRSQKLKSRPERLIRHCRRSCRSARDEADIAIAALAFTFEIKNPATKAGASWDWFVVVN
jgi:hypothetical protein